MASGAAPAASDKRITITNKAQIFIHFILNIGDLSIYNVYGKII
ncbi:hypothetical protein E24_00175 [Faustovirus]|nr:hypothetical protein E24_00175 [Faustovirus]